ERQRHEDIRNEIDYYQILKKRDDEREIQRARVERKLKSDFSNQNKILMEMKHKKKEVSIAIFTQNYFSQQIKEEKIAAEKANDELNRMRQNEEQRRKLEKDYLSTVLKAQMENKTKENINRLPYRIGNNMNI